MSDDARQAPSALKGRLADVFVPALVCGQLEALGRRLGNRATVDDPMYGRASSLASLEPMLVKLGAFFATKKASYRHVYSTTGVDRDTAEGVLAMTVGGDARELPIAVVAERRRLREIELRVYYATEDATKPKPRSPLVAPNLAAALPAQVAHIVEALRRGAIEVALGSFEEQARAVDPHGTWHHKRDGAMGSFLADLGSLALVVGGSADDGRTCCVEGTLTGGGKQDAPALLAFERSNSGLFKELRFYWE